MTPYLGIDKLVGPLAYHQSGLAVSLVLVRGRGNAFSQFSDSVENGCPLDFREV